MPKIPLKCDTLGLKACVWMGYLVMYLLLTKCHQDDRYKEVQHHKGHEHDAGANEECTKHWVVI